MQKLADMDALDVSQLQIVLLDMQQDTKHNTLLTLPEVRRVHQPFAAVTRVVCRKRDNPCGGSDGAQVYAFECCDACSPAEVLESRGRCASQ